MPLKLLQAFCHVTCVYLADLDELYVTGNAPAVHDVPCRLVLGVLFFFAHRSRCVHSLLGPPRRSRFTLLPPLLLLTTHNPQQSLVVRRPSIVLRICCASSPQNFCVFFFLSQVYGFFEGMLEKLELDDDGKCCLP